MKILTKPIFATDLPKFDQEEARKNDMAGQKTGVYLAGDHFFAIGPVSKSRHVLSPYCVPNSRTEFLIGEGDCSLQVELPLIVPTPKKSLVRLDIHPFNLYQTSPQATWINGANPRREMSYAEIIDYQKFIDNLKLGCVRNINLGRVPGKMHIYSCVDLRRCKEITPENYKGLFNHGIPDKDLESISKEVFELEF